MAASDPIDAVLLIAFGGPERMEDVRPFLDNVLRGRPVPRERYEDVVHHYELIGGRSPLNALTFAQADGLRGALVAAGSALPIYVGMRNWSPYIADTLAVMQRDGVRHALGLILAPHRTEASWERYTGAVAAGCAALGAGAPAISYVGSWFDHPLFIETMVSRTRAALAEAPDAPLVFTAHSIPVAMAGDSPYVRELQVSARLVTAAVGRDDFTLAYQSRSGSPRDPWLEPDVNDVVRELAARGTNAVVVVPIGFVCDHVEVRYDLDIELKGIADELGIRLVRAETANDHPTFARMLADVVLRHAGTSSRPG
ncbi:MAG: ferrochelatase [Candidatus Binatia bacterium]